MKSDTRHAAIVATAATVPLVVLVALAIAAFADISSTSPRQSDTDQLPPIQTSAPPFAERHASNCNRVLAALPIQIGQLAPRVVDTTPASPYVVAWGDPAVTMACGVGRPADLRRDAPAMFFNAGNADGPFFEVHDAPDGKRYTIIDREPFISIFIPDAWDAPHILPQLVGAVGRALPQAVCTTVLTGTNQPDLCTRRQGP